MTLPSPIAWITRWPLPALAVWLVAWGLHAQALAWGAPPWAGFVAGVAVGVGGSLLGRTQLRKLVVAAGFPVSLAVLGMGGGLPVWLWLLPVVVLLALYPIRTWGDAPVFPTPAGALVDLHRLAPLVGDRARGTARVLDAGCGLGHALRALRREYPQASIEGIESSWPLMLACGMRCPWADVRQGDFWKIDWAGFDLVYLFQRPESMPRAVEKATREMRPSAYLVSLEFEAPGLRPVATLPGADGRRVWIYRPAVDRDRSVRRPRALLTSPVELDATRTPTSDGVVDAMPALDPVDVSPGRTPRQGGRTRTGEVVDAVELPPRR